MDLQEFEFFDDLEWVKSLSEFKFKKLVKAKAKEVALKNLNKIKSEHSKMDNVFYVNLEMQEYQAFNGQSSLQIQDKNGSFLGKFQRGGANKILSSV